MARARLRICRELHSREGLLVFVIAAVAVRYYKYAAPLFKLAGDRFAVETVKTVSTQHVRHLGMDNADKYDAFITCGGDGVMHELLQVASRATKL